MRGASCWRWRCVRCTASSGSPASWLLQVLCRTRNGGGAGICRRRLAGDGGVSGVPRRLDRQQAGSYRFCVVRGMGGRAGICRSRLAGDGGVSGVPRRLDRQQAGSYRVCVVHRMGGGAGICRSWLAGDGGVSGVPRCGNRQQAGSYRVCVVSGTSLREYPLPIHVRVLPRCPRST
ncbi:hypothetical protein J2Y74_005244 [Pseudomonas migulae]|nr:hypothetical protein [Pseudomonas migulae]